MNFQESVLQKSPHQEWLLFQLPIYLDHKSHEDGQVFLLASGRYLHRVNFDENVERVIDQRTVYKYRNLGKSWPVMYTAGQAMKSLGMSEWLFDEEGSCDPAATRQAWEDTTSLINLTNPNPTAETSPDAPQ